MVEDFRTITVDSNVFPQVNGSSRVRIGDSVDVICSIKADATKPLPDKPNQGIISVDIEISPVCKIGLSEDSPLINSDLIAEAIENSTAFPGEQLCIVPGHFVWTIFVDILVLQMHEDITTASSIAAYVALNNAVLPKTYPKKGNDFDIEGDITQARHIDNALDFPILLPFAKIGNAIVVDATDSEVECASSILTVGIDQRGKMVSFQVAGSKSIDIADLEATTKTASSVASGIFTYLTSYCRSQMQSELDNEFPYLAISSPGLKV
eukprot:gene7717-5548_t